jgi:hypothetical protein
MSVPVASKMRSPEEAEHGDQGEVVGVGRVAGRCEEGFELEVAEPDGGRLVGHGGTANVVGW